MSQMSALFKELRQKDIKLWVDEGRLRFAAPKQAMTPGIKARLSAAKPKLIEYLTKLSAQEPAFQKPPLTQVARGNHLPLSLGQLRLWYQDQFGAANVYHMRAAFRLQGQLNQQALKHSFASIMARHEILRTAFCGKDEEVHQVVVPTPELPLQTVPFPAGPGLEARIRDWVRGEAAKPFDLKQAPLWRVALLRIDPQDHVLVFTMHHIISDGWSLDILASEFAACYRASCQHQPANLPKLPLQYADYAQWQRQFLNETNMAHHASYWRKLLHGLPPLLELPTDRPRPAVQSFRTAAYDFTIPQGLQKRLNDLCAMHGTGMFTLLMTAFQIWLAKITAVRQFATATLVSTRSGRELEGLIGFFVNILVVRSVVRDELPFTELLRQVNDQILTSRRYSEWPFDHLVKTLNPQRSLSHAPIMQTLLTYSRAASSKNADSELELPALKVWRMVEPAEGLEFDLAMRVTESAGGLHVHLQYCPDLFDPQTIQRYAGQFKRLLTLSAQTPQAAIAHLDLLGVEERQQVLWDWNQTTKTMPKNQTLLNRFAAKVHQSPEKIALDDGLHQLSYAALDRMSSQLAADLRKLGVAGGQFTAICTDRSAVLLISLLATLKTGGAYLPMDPDFPANRLAFMLADSAAAVLLTQRQFLDRLAHTNMRVLVWENGRFATTDRSAIPAEPAQHHRQQVPGAEDPAYVIHTSGSTGKPKGVVVSHGALQNFLDSVAHEPGLAAHDKLLAVTTVSFDIAALELFLPLVRGATLVLADKDTASSPQKLMAAIEKKKITAMQATPATWHMLCEAQWQGCMAMQLICGGEALSRGLAQHLLGKGRSLWNMYGPTEATIWATCHRVGPQDGSRGHVTIGKPMANTQCLILDRAMFPAAISTPGELHLGGACLAHGYLNRPALTAARFVPHPFAGNANAGARLYKTGDLAAWQPNGRLAFLGRIDQQVKLRGFRIELGEIEAVLQEHPGIARAAVLLNRGQSDPQLIAFLQNSDAPQPQESGPVCPEMRAFLSQSLPDYMIPWRFELLAEFPLTANGKLDRPALAAQQLSNLSGAFQPPSTETERRLATIWEALLECGPTGRDAHFFALGGHSLLGARLLTQIQASFGVELPLRTLFAAPRLHELATRIDQTMSRESGAETHLLMPIHWQADAPRPLSFAQERLWFLDRLSEGSITYNIPVALHINGPLNEVALEQALNALFARHDLLRTRFTGQDGRPVARVSPAKPFHLEITAADNEDRVRELCIAAARKPFQMADNCPVRFHLYRINGETHVLLVTMHHIISDGWSRAVLVRDLLAFYAGNPPEPLAIQYADYAQWQRAILNEDKVKNLRKWWRDHLSNTPQVTKLPFDFPTSQREDPTGDITHFHVPVPLETALRQLARSTETTLFMVLEAAFAALLARYSDQDCVLLGTPLANRNRKATEPLIGLFVNTLVLRNDLSGQELTFHSLLARTRHMVLDSFEHANLPFEQVVEAAGAVRDLSQSPLFQVMFSLQNVPEQALEAEGLQFKTLPIASGIAKYNLSLSMKETAAGLAGLFEYRTSLFKAATIQQLKDHFLQVLQYAAQTPDVPLAHMSLVNPAQKRQLLHQAQGPLKPYPFEPVHHQIAQQAAHRGKHYAIARGEAGLSYSELNRRANQLAHHFLAHDAQNRLVGVCLEPGLQLPAVILGILKAGAAYVPLSPQYPGGRLETMIDTLALPLIVTTSDLTDVLPYTDAEFLLLDEISLDGNLQAPDIPITAQTPAYAIFTSGSTGVPKAASISHGNLCHLVHGVTHAYEITAEARMLLASNFSFDVFGEEFYPVLVAGGTLVLPEPGDMTSLGQFSTFASRAALNILNLAPHFWQLWTQEMAHGQLAPPAALRTVIVGSDTVAPAWVANWRQLAPHIPVFNAYGPTEATITATVYPGDAPAVEQQYQTVPIGRPLANGFAVILDRQLRLQPQGFPGELFLGGAGLSAGYIKRPALTAQRFLPNPFSDGQTHACRSGSRLYRTGDLAKLLPHYGFQFLGRADHQVKIRGFRIELGEIEAVLAGHPEVKRAAATVYRDQTGTQHLGAFAEVWEPEEITADILTDYLRDQLPGFAVPNNLVITDGFAQTAGGKIDRKQLPIEALLQQETRFTPPQTETEIAVAAIWAELLKLPQVGIHDDFFKLGGHSLLVAQIIARLKARFQLNIPIKTLFTAPTVAAVASEIDSLLDIAAQTTAVEAGAVQNSDMEEFEF